MLKKDANERWTLDGKILLSKPLKHFLTFLSEVLEFPYCKKYSDELKELLADKFAQQCKEESEDFEKESKHQFEDGMDDDI
jgi:hypothetical protein